MELLVIFTCLFVIAGCQNPNKLWLFAVDGRKRPYNFLNVDGKLDGFDVDIVKSVCLISGRLCDMVTTEYTECTYTSRGMNYPGRGLMAGWFDACPGYAITRDRLNGVSFTDAYLDTVSTFTVAPGNPDKFNPKEDDYSRFTLTHLSGAPTNAQCLNRLKKKFGNIIIADGLPEAKALLLNNTAQALFSPRTNISGLDTLPERFKCDLRGAGMMVKKGSELLGWWDKAFKMFYDSGGYNRLCTESIIKYGYPIRCLPPPANQELKTVKSRDRSDKTGRYIVPFSKNVFHMP